MIVLNSWLDAMNAEIDFTKLWNFHNTVREDVLDDIWINLAGWIVTEMRNSFKYHTKKPFFNIIKCMIQGTTFSKITANIGPKNYTKNWKIERPVSDHHLLLSNLDIVVNC